jgi:hypothetical protein
MTDDLDPTVTEGVQTVRLFDPTSGAEVELELGEKNARALNKALAALDKYLAVARKVEAAPEKAVKVQKGEQSKIREWARANGHEVGDRGRIKAEIVNAYYAAQKAESEDRAKADEVDVEDAAKLTVEAPEGNAETTSEAEGTSDEAPMVLDDAAVLALMDEVLAEKGDVELTDLQEKVASKQ